jgi:ankyrin repeat protein
MMPPLLHRSRSTKQQLKVDTAGYMNSVPSPSGTTTSVDNPMYLAQTVEQPPPMTREDSLNAWTELAKALWNDDSEEVMSQLELHEGDPYNSAYKLLQRESTQNDVKCNKDNADYELTLDNINNAIVEAVISDAIGKRFSHRPKYRAGTLRMFAFVVAATFGRLRSVKTILANDKPVGPAFLSCQAFHLACANGHVHVVKFLLSAHHVTSSAARSALVKAASNGHCEVVQLLVQDEHINVYLNPDFVFVSRCQAGDTQRVQEMLADTQVDPSTNDNEAMLRACEEGREHVVKLLLADKRTNPGPGRSTTPIQWAASHNHVTVVQLLVQDERVNPGLSSDFAFPYHCQAGDLKRVEAMLTDPNVNPAANNNYALKKASGNGHEKVVKLLLADQRVDPTAFNNDALNTACCLGHVGVVKLLLADPRVDPSSNNSLLAITCHYGHFEIVKLLLADRRVDPAANNNGALQRASSSGSVPVVKLLLSDPRVDPSDAYVLRSACEGGHHDIVKLLLADARVDPTGHGLIEMASDGGHCQIVRLLVNDERVNPGLSPQFALGFHCISGDLERVRMILTAHPEVDPAADDNHAVRVACSKGHSEIVSLLLGDPRVDPSTNDNDVIIGVCNSDAYERDVIVKLLLTDPRVDPSAQGNRALKVATQNGSTDVMMLLLVDPRVDPSVGSNFALKTACHDGYHLVVKLLLTNPRVDPSADNNAALTAACSVKIAKGGYCFNADLQRLSSQEQNEVVGKVVKVLLTDPRVHPTSSAITAACERGRIKLLELMLAHPGAVVTKDALVAADRENDDVAIRLLTAAHPQVMLEMCRDGAIACNPDGPLQKELKRWEAVSAFTMLLAVKRTQSEQVAGRLSDFCREVVADYTRFEFEVCEVKGNRMLGAHHWS